MSRFFHELQRRKVIRVAVAYIVASWVLMEATDFLVPVLSLPEWTSRLVLLLLVVGFVPAAIIAWVYEMTPQGIKRDEEAAFLTRDEMNAPPRRGIVIVAIGILLIIAAAVFWFLGGAALYGADLPRVSRPALHLNARSGAEFGYDTTARPFFELPGTAVADRKHHIERT